MIWKFLVGLGLSALFLWLALRNAELGQVWSAVRTANYVWLIPMTGFTLLSFLLRSIRWRFLLSTVGRLAFRPLVQAVFIGFMGNNVLPARLGELMRVYSIGQSAGVSRSAALGSIVVERLLDVAVLLIMFFIVLAMGRLPEEVRSWGQYLMVAFIPALLGVVLFYVYSETCFSIVRRLAPERFHERLISVGKGLRDGLGVIKQVREIGIAFLLSLPMWGCLVAVVVCAFLALDLHLPPDAGIITLVLMAIGTMIPSAPGFLGTLQFAGTQALRLYEVNPSTAFSVTLLYHAVQWFPVTLIGLVFFLQQHLSVRSLRQLEDEPGQPIEK